MSMGNNRAVWGITGKWPKPCMATTSDMAFSNGIVTTQWFYFKPPLF